MEMGSRLRALAGTERSMVYTGWCTNPKVTVEDALYLTGAGLDTGWAANPFASEIKIYLAPWGRVGILDLVHNVGVVYAAKRFTSGPVGHLRTAEFIVNLDHARLPGHRQSTFLSHRRTLHIWIDDDHTVTVKNPIPGVPLDERSFAWVGKFSLADWVARERYDGLPRRAWVADADTGDCASSSARSTVTCGGTRKGSFSGRTGAVEWRMGSIAVIVSPPEPPLVSIVLLCLPFPSVCR